MQMSSKTSFALQTKYVLFDLKLTSGKIDLTLVAAVGKLIAVVLIPGQ